MKSRMLIMSFAIVVIVLFLIVCFSFLKGNDYLTPRHNTVVRLDSTTFNIGHVVVGKTTSRKIKIVNLGKFPLTIFDVVTSCGCVIVHWPSYPILPGKSDFLEVSYSGNFSMKFHKTISIYANVKDSPIEIGLIGSVVECEKPR